MILEKDFFCQFNSYSNPDIAKRMCGTTSVAMVLASKGKLDPFVTPDHNLDNLFKYLLAFHKNNSPAVKRPFIFGSDTLYVTVGLPHEVTVLEDDIISKDSEYFPYFSMARGYDHRFSKFLFSNFNINANSIEGITASYVFDQVFYGKVESFLASIRSKFGDSLSSFRSSHIVIVHKAFIQDNEKYIEYIDCSEQDYTNAKKTVDINEFEKIFLGHGTEVL